MNLKLNFENLIERLSFANTPAYLYKHYRQDSSIYKLSQENSTAELIEFLKKALCDVGSISELATVYAILIALTFKKPEEVTDFFVALQNSHLRWADKLAEIYFLNSSIKSVEYSFDLSDDIYTYDLYYEQPKVSIS